MNSVVFCLVLYLVFLVAIILGCSAYLWFLSRK
jgi:hypothetical protein